MSRAKGTPKTGGRQAGTLKGYGTYQPEKKHCLSK